MANKIIKMVILLENILCIYRKTSSTRKNHIFIYFRFLIEAIMIFSYVYSCYLYLTVYNLNNVDYVVFYLNLGNSFIIMFLAWYKSRDFNQLLVLINQNNARLKNDGIYQRRIKKKLPRVVCALTLTFVVPLLISYAQFVEDEYKRPYTFLVFSICSSIFNIRYILEYVMMYTLLFTLSELTKCFTRKLKKEGVVVALIKVGKNNFVENSAENLIECSIIYKNIKECFRLINSIFAALFTVILATVTAYFVIVVYGIIFTGVKLRPSVSIVVLTFMKFSYFFVPLYKVSSMAQATENSVDSLRRHIAHRLITLPLDDVSLKSTRGFLQLVRPIKIQASGSINIDMALIPKIIMFFTTYTVTALQFNNVI